MPRARASRPITTPLRSASCWLNVAATPIVDVMPVESWRVITPGGPSLSFNDGIPSRGMPGRYPA